MSELPKGWALAPVGDLLADLPSGKTIDQGWSPRCENFPSESEETWGALKTTAIQDGWFEAQHTKQLPTHLDPKPELEVRAGDILLTCAGPRMRCGVICRVANVRRKLFISGKMYRFRANGSIVDDGFLLAQMRSAKLQLEIDRIKTGGSESGLNLTQSRFRNLLLSVPPLAEQKRIVAKLDALGARSARARKELERIDALVARYKQAVLSEAFSGELTKDWRQGSLDQVISESLVGLVRSKADQSVSGGTPYIRMNHFDLAGNWNSDNLTTVQLTSSELALYQLRPNDLLFNTRNSFELVGKVALWDKTAGTHVFNNNILRLRFKSDVIPKFALLQMRSPPFRTYLESVKSATTSVCAIYQKSLMRAPFHVPSTDHQKEIVRRIESAFEKIDRLAGEAKRALALVGRLDEAVLAKAFRGELVPQDPNDEPASVLLERIRAERAAAPKPKRGLRKAP